MAWGEAKATWIVNGDWPQQPYIVACCVFRSSARYTGYNTVHTSISKVTLVSKRDTHSWYMLPWPFRLHVHVHVHVALLPHCYLTEAAVSIKWCVYVYTHTHTQCFTCSYQWDGSVQDESLIIHSRVNYNSCLLIQRRVADSLCNSGVVLCVCMRVRERKRERERMNIWKLCIVIVYRTQCNFVAKINKQLCKYGTLTSEASFLRGCVTGSAAILGYTWVPCWTNKAKRIKNMDSAH